MKKLGILLMTLVMCLGLSTCAFAEEDNWKIAILTGTTSQGEEEFRAAERAAAKYPDHIITDTYPDNFTAETETTISKLVSFASDEDVKMLVDELKKEIGAEYIEAPLEMEGTDLSKVSFARTLKALDALTKAYKSTILSAEGNVYKLTLTKETIKSETGAIQSAVEKTPKKILPLLADLLDAFAADVEALGDEALGDEDGKLAELKEDAKELREIVNSKEMMMLSDIGASYRLLTSETYTFILLPI